MGSGFVSLTQSGGAPSQPVTFTPHEAVVTQTHPAPAAGVPHTRGRTTTERSAQTRASSAPKTSVMREAAEVSGEIDAIYENLTIVSGSLLAPSRFKGVA